MRLSEAYELFKKLPLLLEEFVDDSDALASYGNVNKKISPLLSLEKMLGARSSAADMVLNNVPLYCVTSDTYSTTRDPARLDVPRSMQTEFWATWFRDAMASESNSVILDTFNKLQYPFLGEEHILNRVLLKKVNTFFPDAEETGFYLVEGEVDGKLDSVYLDDIVDQKLRSAYTLCDYTPAYSGFIDSWMESLYLSGQLTYDEMVREQNLYKIQDLKAELIRRKFAGSAALYHVVLSAINRRGTYASAIPLKTVDTSDVFKDNRLIRALYLPGITVDTSKERHFNEDVLSAFDDIVPHRTLIPLYYSSNGRVGSYSSDAFDGFVSGTSSLDYLRSNSTSFAWDNLRGITDASVLMDRYPRLDSGIDYHFDKHTLLWDGDTLIGAEPSEARYLDTVAPIFNMSAVAASFFDVQADQILYHRNSQQDILGHGYPYVTYTIADNNSLSMMDIPWLDYIEQVLASKTRVQEDVRLGVQVSRLVTDEADTVRENFTVITFDSTINLNFSTQQAKYDASTSKYAYLWNISILYSFESFMVKDITPKLITYMLLQVSEDDLAPATIEANNQHPSWAAFTETTVGMVPFVYGEMSTSEILARKLYLDDEHGLVDDLYEEEYGKATFLFTTKENVAIAKRYLRTSPSDLMNTSSDEITSDWFSIPPSDEALKHVIYGITRKTAEGAKEYAWSEPLRLYPMGNPSLWSTGSTSKLAMYRPDWQGLISYINPYLNFTAQSASPIRGRQLAYRALRPATEDQPLPEELPTSWSDGPSTQIALTDLNVARGYDVYLNVTGDVDSRDIRGTYFHRVRQVKSAPEMEQQTFIDTEERLQVWGDNRAFLGDNGYATDSADNWEADTTRSVPYQDDLGVFALRFEPGSQYTVTAPNLTYYTLQPAKDISSLTAEDWAAWIWNDPDNEIFSNGMTACIDCSIMDPSIPRGSDTTDVADYYLLSYEGEDLAAAIYASFNWYFTTDHRLVFEVYPTGNLDGALIWSVAIDASFILTRQSQLAISYRADVADGGDVHIEQSIVADRVWDTVYRVVHHDDITGSYLIYETAADFDITGLTPKESVSEASAPANFGKLVKFGGALADNSLRDICVLNRDHGYNPFLGTLYDFRLYRRGVSIAELILLGSGTRRELYSYSPSLYKLVYQHYSDPGVLRRVTPVASGEANPSRIRAFNRSVWDSILVDLFPVSAEEQDTSHALYKSNFWDPVDDYDIYERSEVDLKEGVLSQILVPYYEAASEVNFPSTMQIIYRGERINLDGDDRLTFLQTTIYPVQYQNEAFESGIELKPASTSTPTILNLQAYTDELETVPAGSHVAVIPSVPAGDTLNYQCDLDINFKMSTIIDAASPLLKGSNIGVRCLPDGSTYVLHHITDSATKTSENNMVVLPLYIPQQSTNEYSLLWRAELLGLELRDVMVSSSLSTLLKSSSYYNELQVPYAVEVSPSNIKYTSRWDAIRTLREGSYFTTVKYPVQFRPFTNAEAKKTPDVATIYAAARFKVVVRGEAQYYEEPLMDPIDGWIGEESLRNTLKNGLYRSTDNCNYPHRKIKIDLYVMKHINSVADWDWYKIASNYDTDTVGVQLLTPEAFTQNGALKLDAVPTYFSPSYLAPLFVAGGVTDTIAVTIRGGQSGAKEQLKASSESDLATLTLLSGRSYKMLLDYSARVVELSYSDEYHTTPEIAGHHELSAEELASYNRCGSLLNGSYTGAFYNSTYSYSGRLTDYNFRAARTGFVVQPDGTFATVNTDSEADTCALGDPYNGAASKNLLVAGLSDNRPAIDSLAYFPYKQQDLSTGASIPAVMMGALYGTPIRMLVTANGYQYTANSTISEEGIVTNHALNRLQVVRGALLQPITSESSSGLFTGISAIQPTISGASLVTEERVTTSTYDMYAYRPSQQTVRFVGPFDVQRQTLLQNNSYSDPHLWAAADYTVSTEVVGHVYDSERDADVFTMSTPSAATITCTQRRLKAFAGILSVDVKCSEAATVALTVGGVQLASVAVGASVWTTVTATIATTAVKELVISFIAATTFTNASMSIDNLTLRGSSTIVHTTGLSDAVAQGLQQTSQRGLLLAGGSGDDTMMVVLKNKNTGQYFPLQFSNTLLGASDNRNVRKMTLINNYSWKIDETSEENALLRPWVRRLFFEEHNPQNARLYAYRIVERDQMMVSELYPLNTSEVFMIDNSSADPEDRSVQYNASANTIEFGGATGLQLNVVEAEALLGSNLRVNTIDPISVSRETFSLAANSAHPANLEQGIPSPVVITNIQVLNDDADTPAILYELEYLPIIYDESRHHLSVNLLVKSN